MAITDKNCDLCGTGMVALTLHFNSADAYLCPNCSVMWALNLMKPGDDVLLGMLGAPKPSEEHECCLCNDPAGTSAVAVVHDFKFDDDRTDIHWHVCDGHARAFHRLRLEPPEVKALIAAAECETFMTHSDFYDEDGNACQAR